MSAMRSGFGSGLSLGLALGAVTGATLIHQLLQSGIAGLPQPGVVLGWIWDNLGLSLIPFTVVLLAFLHALNRLDQTLTDAAPGDEVVHAESLVNVWIGVFFGIGVIWTAIGMRAALVHALGGPAVEGAMGAQQVLRGMVEGGILVALSTTIFGGVGGYLMRVFKTLRCGARLQAHYLREGRAQGEQMIELLARIDSRLDKE